MKNYLPKDNFTILRKLIIFAYSLIFFLIVFFLIRWQFIEVESFQGLAQSRYQERSISSIRGDIIGRNGETLAYSAPRWNVFAYIGDMREAEAKTATRDPLQSREEFIRKVSSVLGISEKELRFRLELLSCTLWSEIAEQTDKEKRKEIKDMYLNSKSDFYNEATSILGISRTELESRLSYCPHWIKIASKVDIETKQNLETIPREGFIEKIPFVENGYKGYAMCLLQREDTKACDELKENSYEKDEVRAYIEDNKQHAYLTGLNYEFTSERIYPEKELASHVIGFLGKDLNANDIGRGGVEQKYNGILEPQEGFIAGETDGYGNLIAISDSISIDAKRGSSIKLTIDKNIQKIIEKKIEEGVNKYEAISGSIIVLDPKTGEILGLANYPTYNPEKYFEVEDSSVFTNRTISIPYEVGSVAKVFTLSAAIEEMDIKGDEIVIDGHEGCTIIHASEDEYDFREICTFDKKPQGPLTLTEALIKSDNLAFVELGTRLGKKRLHKYLSQFGVGKMTSVDLSGESIGYLPKLDNDYAWHPVDVAVFSYGHGYQLNMLQITRGIATIPNKGWLMQPYIVSEIINEYEQTKKFEPIPIRKIVSDETTRKVKIIMEELFIRHTERDYKYLQKYQIASKSGTALIPYKDKPGYSSDVNVTYIGFDSSEEAKFIMAVKLEAPQAVEKLSFYSARPLWLETFDELKGSLRIEPKNDEDTQ
ncbi:hypothetical protein GF362_02645 [Candidatus Dojkabacteria bacterium]|nr:hypothetical protein [Candidatus Dojkabacteria bacterium]